MWRSSKYNTNDWIQYGNSCIQEFKISSVGSRLGMQNERNFKRWTFFVKIETGGQTSLRPYWRFYYQNTPAIIYVIDSTDHERLGKKANTDYDCYSAKKKLGISKTELFSILAVSQFRFIVFPHNSLMTRIKSIK